MSNKIDKSFRQTLSLKTIKVYLVAFVTDRKVLLFGSLIIAAFAMRAWGLDFGLPYRYHIDETFYVALALKLPSNNFDMPVITHGPNLFYLFLLVEYVFYYIIALFIGQVSSIAAFEQLYRTNPTNFILLARLTSAVAGTLTLVPVYLLGKKTYGQLTGLIAAILLGFTFQHIRESHYGTPDVFVGLLVTFCLLACMNILKRGLFQDYLIASVFAGLATGTKFTNFLLWVPLLVGHIYHVRVRHSLRQWLKEIIFSPNLWTSIAIFIISFAIAYPNLLLRPKSFLEYVTFLIEVGKNGFIPQFIIEPSPAWFYYIYSLSWGLGWLLLGVAVLSIGLALVRREPEELLLLSFVFIYLIFLIRSPYYGSRYLVPLLPILCLFAANGILWLANYLTKYLNFRTKTLIVLIIILMLVQPISSAWRHNFLLGQTDTRTLAKMWIEKNISEGTVIAVDWRQHAPPLRTVDDNYPNNAPQYNLIEAGGIGLPQNTIESYGEGGVQYIVISSFIESLPLAEEVDVEKRESFQEQLRDSSLVYEIQPYSGEAPRFIFDQLFGPVVSLWRIDRPGPTLKIYQLQR